jgi:membrane protein
VKIPGRDVPLKKFLVRLKDEYLNDGLMDAAGALTFFGVLAMFPFLLFLVALASVLIQPEQARSLIEQLGQVAPPAVTQILGDRIQTLAQQQNVGLLSIGAAGAIWAASSGVAAVTRALNTAYGVEESRSFLKVRGISLLFTLGGGLLGIIAAMAVVATPALASAVGGPLGTAIMWLRIPVGALVALLVWALAYYFLPDVKQKFRFITPGSAVGVAVWLLASWGFSFYVKNFGNYDATYGSLGGVIVLLLWMWISSQVLLLGAEMNAIIEDWSPEGKDLGERVPPGEDGSDRLPGEDRARGRGFVMAQRGARPGADGKHAPSPIVRAEKRAGSSATRSVALALWGAVAAVALVRLRRPA